MSDGHYVILISETDSIDVRRVWCLRELYQGGIKSVAFSVPCTLTQNDKQSDRFRALKCPTLISQAMACTPGPDPV